jgi:hypothetical protein
VGGDAASPRYIYTYAAPATRLLFRPEDDALLEQLQEEGTEVEPVVYWPVFPAPLLNGSPAIATGFSANVPGFRPSEVVANVRLQLKAFGKRQIPYNVEQKVKHLYCSSRPTTRPAAGRTPSNRLSF